MKLFSLLLGMLCSILCVPLFAQYSADFDGIDDYAYRSHHRDFDFGKNDFTIEAQISNLGSTGSDQAIYSKHSKGGGLEFGINKSGRLYVIVGSTTIIDSGNSKINDRECHHIAVSRESGIVTFYLDGSSFAASGSYTQDVDNSNAIYIGSRFNSTFYFKGYLDELRVWNVAKSAGQIDDYAKGCITGSEDNLVAYWHIESPSQVFDDATLHHHDARLGDTYTADAADPQWVTEACYKVCCNATADFLIDITAPLAYQYVNFTNASSNTSSYQWIVNGNMESTNTDFSFAFPLGTHIVQLVAFGDSDCRSFKTWVVEVTQDLNTCGAPTIVNNCNFEPYENPTQPRLFDAFGNCFTPENVALPVIPKTTITPGIHHCGLFTLYFQDVLANTGTGTNVGFDAPGTAMGAGFSSLGEERQECLCRVFEDLSVLLGGTMAAGQLRVSIERTDGNSPYGPIPAGVGASASPLLQEFTSPQIHKFAMGEAAKTIIGGQDSYASWAMYNNALTTAPHGYILFNSFASVSFNSNMSVITTTPNHLYQTALHEAVHILGFRSLVDITTGTTPFSSRVTSSNAPNIYSYYDQFLESNQTSIFNTTTTNGILAITAAALPATCSGTAGATPVNGIAFDNVPNASNHPIFHNGPYQPGSTFSHFNCNAGTPGYIMNFSGISGWSLHPNEVLTLCRLGYNIGNTYGINRTAINQSNTTVSYPSCTPTACIPVGFTDIENPSSLGNPFTVVRTGGNNSVTINNANLLANDANATGITGLQIITGGGTITPGANSFTYSPNLGFGLDWAVLSYVPTCSNGTISGELTYIFIWVQTAPYPACNLPQSSCNLVCNGDFENFLFNYGSRHSQLENFAANYTNRTVNVPGTVDLLNYTQFNSFSNWLSIVLNSHNPYDNCQGTYTVGTLPFPRNFPNNNNVLGMGHTISSTNAGNAESFYLELSNALMPPTIPSTNNYRIGFWIYASCTNFDLRFIFGDAPPCPLAGSIFTSLNCDLRGQNTAYVASWSALGSAPPNCTTWGNAAHHHNMAVNVNNPGTVGNYQWFYVTQDFNVAIPNLQHIIVHPDLGSYNGPSNWDGIYFLIDDITIEPIGQPQINITSTIQGPTCPGGQPTIVYTIQADPANQGTLTNIQLNTTLPTSIPATLSYASGGNFTNGQATIPSLTPGQTVTLSLPLQVAGNAVVGTSHSVLIDAIAAGACVSATSSQTTNMLVTNTVNQLTVNTTILSSAPYNIGSTVQYQIQVTNTGPNAINDIDLDVPAVVGLNFTFNPALFNLNAGATQTFTFNATATANGCAVLCAEIISANFACILPVGCAPSIAIGGGSNLTYPIEIEGTPQGNETIDAVTTDANNNIYIVGRFQNPFVVPNSSVTLQPLLGCNFNYSVFVIKYSPCGLEWARTIPACHSIDGFTVPDIEVNATGDVFVATPVSNSFIFGSNTYTYHGGGADFAIFKYNAQGNPVWARLEGGANEETVSDMELDGNRVVVTGYFNGLTTNSLQIGAATYTYPSYPTQAGINMELFGSKNPGHSFVASYIDNGTTLSNGWSEVLQAPMASGKLSVDANGNIYTIGMTLESFAFPFTLNSTPLTNVDATFAGGTPSFFAGNNGDIDFYVLSYSSTGTRRWGRLYGGTGVDINAGSDVGSILPADIEVDNNGNVYATLTSTATLSPIPAGATLSFQQEFGTHLLRLNPNDGAPIWSRAAAVATASNPLLNLNGNAVIQPTIMVDNLNNPYLGGTFLLHSFLFNSINFYNAQGGTLINAANMAGFNFNNMIQTGSFVEKFNPNGNFQWVEANTSLVPTNSTEMWLKMYVTDLEWSNAFGIYESICVDGAANFNAPINGNPRDAFLLRLNPTTTNYYRPLDNSNTLPEANNLGAEAVAPASGELSTMLYPNPTTGIFTLALEHNSAIVNVNRIRVFDITGKIVLNVFEGESNDSKFSIDMSPYPAGTYFVEIMANDQNKTERIVLIK